MIMISVVFLAAQALSQELNSTLHDSTLNGIQVAYPGDTVVFTCKLRGSNSLVWESDEYIGVDQRLTFASAEPNRTELRAIGNSETVGASSYKLPCDDVISNTLVYIIIMYTFYIYYRQCHQ